MKRQFQSSSTILQCGMRLFACCLLANGIALHAQNKGFVTSTSGTPPPGGAPLTVKGNNGGAPYTVQGGSAGVGSGVQTRGGGEFGLVINGSDIGTILLKTCDLDQNGAVSLAELKKVAAAVFNLWDTNRDAYISQAELATGLRELFPAPPAGGLQGTRVVNGVAVQVAPGDLPTPDGQVTKHLLAEADSNKDGLLSLQELGDYFDKNFSQWDKDGDGALGAAELNMAVSELAKPD